MKQLIIFATGNKNKIREIRDIITDPGRNRHFCRRNRADQGAGSIGAYPPKDCGRHFLFGHSRRHTVF